MKSSQRDRILAVVVTLPMLVVGVTWGLPRAVSPETVGPWGYDELAPLQPLNEAYSRFTRAQSSYLAYPLFHSVVLTIADTPYLATELLLGRLKPHSTYPYGMSDPIEMNQRLTLIGRVVSVVMALSAVLLVYEITRTLFARRQALWAATVVGLLPTFVFYGKTSNVDVPYVLWTLACCLCATRVVMGDDRARLYVGLGVFAALAVATKDQAAGFVAPLVIPLVAARFQRDSERNRLKRLWNAAFGQPMIVGLCLAVVTFALANNLLFGWDGFVRHLQVAREMSSREAAFSSDLRGQLGLLARSAWLLVLTVGPVSLLAILGLLRCVRQGRWQPIGLLVLPVLGHHVIVLMRIDYVYSRFMLAAAVLTVILGAGALNDVPGRAQRRLLVAVAALSVGYAAFLSFNVDRGLLFDARYAAEAWIRDNVPSGSSIEVYSPEQRVLPRVWGTHRAVTVPLESMNADELGRRSSDYILVTDLLELGMWQKPQSQPYLESLFAGRLGYRQIASFETPSPMPADLRRLIPGTNPRVFIFERTDR